MSGHGAAAAPARPAGGQGARGVSLFILAHHDDEVFCAGHLLQALAGGRRVLILWATAGGLAPPRRRVYEGTRARRVLGLAPGDARDLWLPDQGALEGIGQIVDAAEALLAAATPHDADRAARCADGATDVHVPAYEGGHPDHDAVNLAAAVLRSRRPGILTFEFPVYRREGFGLSVQAPDAPAGTPTEPFGLLALDARALALRRRLARANASQLLPSLLPLLALARVAGRGRVEPSRPLPLHDYSRPPHDGRLLYELYTRRRFEEFRRAAAAALPVRS